ncbi:MAG TPA: VOC family protein [Longimicrobiaceae bacterium]|nr:VOC family protein [Longimicrobiaceae bacterium]
MREITPYLNFDGSCREAMTFYQRCLGGELHVMTFADGGFDSTPGAEERVLHARLVRGPTMLMASDTMPGTPYQQGTDIHLNFFLDSDEEVETLYPALSEGGQEVMAPHDAFWGARFAMFVDRFGVHWMLNHERQPHG